MKKIMYMAKSIFVKMGVLPLLLVVSVAIFAAISDNFLTVKNFVNVIRQSSFLILVSMGQMFALLTGGFDLSVGTIVAFSSVISALVMAVLYGMMPESVWVVIVLGVMAGIGVGMIIGAINGIGVSLFDVSPFMMTLGISSVGFGLALYITGGSPVYGMPTAFADIFGFGDFMGIPAPVVVMVCVAIGLYLLLNHTAMGRYFYAVGGNRKAAELSGINTKGILFLAYFIVASITAIAGILLTARLDTGEANIGTSMPLESIAACVIAGVSLRGGVGRIENVVLGAFFIGLVQNGMNLARIESYLQIVVLGIILIFAVIVDRIRLRVAADIQS